MRSSVRLSALFLLLFPSLMFSQGGNATLGGVVTDSTGALLPGVTIVVTNTETSVTNTVITNETGSYQFSSLQPGNAYRASASLPGFQTNTVTNIELGVATTNRQDFKLAVATTQTRVEVVSEANSVITAAGASVGDVLPDYRIRDLPLVGNNVLDLLDILPGLRSSAAGEAFDTIAGLGTDSINVTRDGLPTNDNRYTSQGFGGYGRGVFSSVNLPPDLVGEIRLILTPVDAELGRGNSQIQIQTRSGTNRYTGSAVWNIQNTALNANTWANNHNVNAAGEWEPQTPDWRNQHHFTVSYGGPLIRNKTFFFALWDQNISNTREVINNTVLTDTARQGIMRYWTDWNPNDAAGSIPTTFPQTGTTRSWPSVNDLGQPVRPTLNANGTPYTGELICFSVFGNKKADGSAFTAGDCPGGRAVFGPASGAAVWDAFRPVMDPTGYISKLLDKMPRANNYRSGDGLNTARFSWLRGRSGSNSNPAIVGADAYTNRKQINLKIDQNFAQHRISGNWTYQRDDSGDNVAQWPNGLSGAIYRRPQILTINATSTLSTTLLNEARFGVNYNKTDSVPAWFSPYSSVRDEARSLLFKGGAHKNGSIYDVVVNPSTGGIDLGGYMSAAPSNIGNVSPLWQYSDTLSWTHNRHAFKFGAELRLPRSNGYNLQPYPSATVGNPTGSPAPAPFTGTAYATELPLFLNTVRGLSSSLTYILNGSIGSVSHQYWIENQTQVDNKEWVDTVSTSDGNYNKYRDQILKEWAFFAKDDYKITRSLTLNLGLRWEYFASPYLKSGLTSTLADQGDGLFGAGRGAGKDLFNTYLQPGRLFLTGYGTSTTTPLTCATNVTQSALLPVSNCDPGLLSKSIFVGPNTVNPGQSLIPPDKNNFGPAIGFSWQPPFLGQGKTTVRGGYQITYGSAGRNGITLDSILGSAPGNSIGGLGVPGQNFTVTDTAIQNIFATRALNLTDIPVLIPARPTRDPGATIPIYARSVTYTAYDPNYATPYTQNFNLSVTRSLNRLMTLDVRYVGTMAKKQAGSFDINETTTYYNPELFDALTVTRAGGNAPLFDQMFAGLNLNNGVTGYGAVGTVVNGILQTGSAHLRRTGLGAGNNIPSISQDLANGNFDALVGKLLNLGATGFQTLPINPATGVTITGVQQRAIRNGCDRLANNLQFIGSTPNSTTLPAGNNPNPNRCFPEDYFIANPQLSTATYNANLGHNKYHSLQVQFTLRPVQGFNFQSTYSWAKGMEMPGSGYINPLNRQLDYRPQSLPAHDFRLNGGFEIPIGPNKLLLGNSSGWLARVIEKWQTNIILNARTGEFLTPAASKSNLYGGGRLDEVNPIWRELATNGNLEWNGNNNAADTLHGGTFYGNPGPFISVRDPQCTGPLVAGPDPLGANLQSTNNCSLDALGVIVPAGTPGALVTSTGQPYVIALQNPEPGRVGTLGTRVLRNFGRFSLDASLSKTFRITESKSVQLRVDSTNVLNHPTPASPSMSIDTFGLISGGSATNPGKSGSRTLQAQVRLSF